MRTFVTKRALTETLHFLRRDGRRHCESVALWLGRRRGNEVRVVEAVRPDQEAGRDFFHIPLVAMELLRRRLRDDNLMIAAQVHSHPQYAFHSEADDTWAIVRHVGALSLVLPHFAQSVTVATFWRDAALFAMSESGEWCSANVREHIAEMT